MTILAEFIQEIASELDARNDKPLAPHHWIGFVKLLRIIDDDDKTAELRQKMEQVVSQRDVRFQDRCLALIPFLAPIPVLQRYLPGGATLQSKHLRRCSCQPATQGDPRAMHKQASNWNTKQY